MWVQDRFAQDSSTSGLHIEWSKWQQQYQQPVAGPSVSAVLQLEPGSSLDTNNAQFLPTLDINLHHNMGMGDNGEIADFGSPGGDNMSIYLQ